MKLDIIGSVASGKTTLAREISVKYQIPFYEKDNIVWVFEFNAERKKITESLTEYGAKYRTFKNSKQAIQFIEEMY